MKGEVSFIYTFFTKADKLMHHLYWSINSVILHKFLVSYRWESCMKCNQDYYAIEILKSAGVLKPRINQLAKTKQLLEKAKSFKCESLDVLKLKSGKKKKLNILVIECDPILGIVHGLLLHNSGLNVEVITGLEKGFENNLSQYDVVFINTCKKNYNTPELIKIIHERLADKSLLPICAIVTRNFNSKSIHFYNQHNIYSFLATPISLENFQDVIRKLVPSIRKGSD